MVHFTPILPMIVTLSERSATVSVVFYIIGSAVMLFAWFTVFWLWSRPLRMRGHALRLLDALRFALGNGIAPETALRQLAENNVIRHRGLRRAVRCLDGQASLETALRKLGTAAPAQIRGLLIGGIRMGNLKKVVPLGNRLLAHQASRTEAFSHYLFLILFHGSLIFLVAGLQLTVLPRIWSVVKSFSGGPDNARPSEVAPLLGVASTSVFVIALVLVVMAVSYVFGRQLLPRAVRLPADFLAQRLLPWQRLRSRRDFALMLSACLDGDMNETEAVRVAAETTGNSWLVFRAERAGEMLEQGIPLPDVCTQLLDRSGELAWRLRSSRMGIGADTALEAVDGWCRYLEAAAFRDEQAAAQFCSTAMLLLVAVCIGTLGYALVTPYCEVVRGMFLW